eukprot:5822271-Amphidinium_carterae.1
MIAGDGPGSSAMPRAVLRIVVNAASPTLQCVTRANLHEVFLHLTSVSRLHDHMTILMIVQFASVVSTCQVRGLSASA